MIIIHHFIPIQAGAMVGARSVATALCTVAIIGLTFINVLIKEHTIEVSLVTITTHTYLHN